MKKIFITALFFVVAFHSSAQNKYVDSLKTVLANTAKPFDQFALENKIADYFFISGHGNVDSSLCLEMLRIATQLDNDSLLAIGYNIVGNYFFFYNGDYSKALEYFFKALPFAEKAKDKRRISSVYIDIAQVYLKLNNLDEQLKYLTKASENLPAQSSPMYFYLLVQIQYQFSYHFFLLQKLDSALHYAQALKESNLYLKSPVYECAAYGMMGSVYSKMGDSVFADTYWKRAVLIVDSVDYTYAKFEIKKYYIDFLLQMNRNAEAEKQARQLMALATKENNFDVQRIAAGMLRNIFDLCHKTDSAYYYSRLESAMKDSVFGQSNLNKIQSLGFSEKLRLIDEQEKLAIQEEQRKENIQYALIALGIIVLFTLYLLLSRSFITNTKLIEFFGVIALLIVFEFLNLLLHPFLERITNHSPIIMLLALVCIAALLVPLHHRLEKWATKKLVEKNKAIRLAAAKKTIEKLEKNKE
jgi:tetratricopeptide (TPR) repeat protein